MYVCMYVCISIHVFIIWVFWLVGGRVVPEKTMPFEALTLFFFVFTSLANGRIQKSPAFFNQKTLIAPFDKNRRSSLVLVVGQVRQGWKQLCGKPRQYVPALLFSLITRPSSTQMVQGTMLLMVGLTSRVIYMLRGSGYLVTGYM